MAKKRTPKKVVTAGSGKLDPTARRNVNKAVKRVQQTAKEEGAAMSRNEISKLRKRLEATALRTAARKRTGRSNRRK